MNEKIMKSLGFEKEINRIHNKRCPFCNKKINMSDFRDELSKKEYFISGLCQKCQDEIFES